MPKTKKKHHIHSHHNAGLAWMIKSPADTIKAVRIADIVNDFIRSVTHNLNVVVVKPYLFSI